MEQTWCGDGRKVSAQQGDSLSIEVSVRLQQGHTYPIKDTARQTETMLTSWLSLFFSLPPSLPLSFFPLPPPPLSEGVCVCGKG